MSVEGGGQVSLLTDVSLGVDGNSPTIIVNLGRVIQPPPANPKLKLKARLELL